MNLPPDLSKWLAILFFSSLLASHHGYTGVFLSKSIPITILLPKMALFRSAPLKILPPSSPKSKSCPIPNSPHQICTSLNLLKSIPMSRSLAYATVSPASLSVSPPWLCRVHQCPLFTTLSQDQLISFTTVLNISRILLRAKPLAAIS